MTLGNVGVDVVEGVDRVLREPSAGFVSVQRRAAVGVSVEVDVGTLHLWRIRTVFSSLTSSTISTRLKKGMQPMTTVITE